MSRSKYKRMKRSSYKWYLQKAKQRNISLTTDYSYVSNKYFRKAKGSLYLKFKQLINQTYDINQTNNKLKIFFKKHRIPKKDMICWAWTCLLQGYEDESCHASSNQRYYGEVIGFSMKCCNITKYGNKVLEAMLYYYFDNNCQNQNIKYSKKIKDSIKLNHGYNNVMHCTSCFKDLMIPIFDKYDGIGLNMNKSMGLCGYTPLEYAITMIEYEINIMRILIDFGAEPTLHIKRCLLRNDQKLLKYLEPWKFCGNHYPFLKNKKDFLEYLNRDQRIKINLDTIKLIIDFCGDNINDVVVTNKWKLMFSSS